MQRYPGIRKNGSLKRSSCPREGPRLRNRNKAAGQNGGPTETPQLTLNTSGKQEGRPAPTRKEEKETWRKRPAAEPTPEHRTRREKHIADMAPPLNQTIKEKQDAVRAVASLGLRGAASPHRSESLSEQDSGQMKSLAPHRTQLIASHESLQGHQMKSFETSMKNRACPNEGPVTDKEGSRGKRCSSTGSTDMRLIHNPPTASITGAPGLGDRNT
ncbi:hypothetical protein NDU88_005640 [Pleurodeles waltl]|uniref:Uncharacterized protein n=1 Tax=Pleurodeles waltl TaxID=8319 RepID=A0AAV7QLV0_PLEWA|nr:hypothetical protein NDU88_005640 [Pleurodeles waltl]